MLCQNKTFQTFIILRYVKVAQQLYFTQIMEAPMGITNENNVNSNQE